PTSGPTTDTTPASTPTKPPTSGPTTDTTPASTPTKPPTSGPTTDTTPASTPTKPPTSGPTTDTTPASTPTKPPSPTPASTATPQTETPPTKGPSLSPNTESFSTQAPSTAPEQGTTAPPSACASNPCPGESTCEDRADLIYLCLCLAGEFHYKDRGCEKSKVFFRLLFLEIPYNDKMADKTSQTFNETANTITYEIDKQFRGVAKGYVRVLVLELRKNMTTTVRSDTINVEASIEIIYEATSDITEENVRETMEKVVCETCPLAGSFQVKSACDSTACEETSSDCRHKDGLLTCECKHGYLTSNYTERLCVACPAGKKAEDGTCKS
uniref:SEA domain-containing protein n=1 Tax=Poecilia mexicana TaxID=48701 RepID=A0A3B3Z3D9_9TELE